MLSEAFNRLTEIYTRLATGIEASPLMRRSYLEQVAIEFQGVSTNPVSLSDISTSSVVSANWTMAPGTFAYVPDGLEIADGVLLEIGDGSILEIG